MLLSVKPDLAAFRLCEFDYISHRKAEIRNKGLLRDKPTREEKLEKEIL